MSLRIAPLTPAHEPAYEQLLQENEHSLLYMSLEYRSFLRRILESSEDHYLLAFEGDRLRGALPSFVTRHPSYGPVLNALPFYGSNGGIVVSPEAENPDGVRRALLEAFETLALQESVKVSTLISNPLAADHPFFEAHGGHTLRDERIGQITPLPDRREDPAAMDAALMERFHYKTRNSIRKAMKSGLTVSHSGAAEAMATLARLHQENMRAIGGAAKSLEVFEAIREVFTYDRDYRVYLAEADGKVVSALLVFFHHRTAEYYTPATLESYRSWQPMSLLIFEGMKEAVRRGCRHWNWGGTWLSQGGVYQFKSRWGTRDYPYFYYVREYEAPSPLRRLAPSEILAAYPYYYVLPFSALEGSV